MGLLRQDYKGCPYWRRAEVPLQVGPLPTKSGSTGGSGAVPRNVSREEEEVKFAMRIRRALRVEKIPVTIPVVRVLLPSIPVAELLRGQAQPGGAPA